MPPPLLTGSGRKAEARGGTEDCGVRLAQATRLLRDRRMVSLEERRQRIIAHAFREYGTIRRLFHPDIGGQMTMPLS